MLDCSALVVAEDVHWFDPSTREVLGALLEGADGRLLVVITARPDESLPGNWPATVFDLVPLTDEQTDALISALNPGLRVTERQAVAARCDGVPFYIEQVVAGLGATGVPETLYEPLFARLRASPKVVPVVEAAAVIGRHVDRGLLGSVVDMSDDEVDHVIDELEDALVLEQWGPDGWRFRHELLREVAAELAPPTVRRGLHAKVADALIGAGEPDWGLVAGHYERAERFDKAASAYQSASTAALLRGALAEARENLTRALTQLDHVAASPDRDRLEMALRLERGRLAGATEGYQSASAIADYERCLQLAGTDLRDEELFATLAALRGYYVTRGDLDRTMQVLESLATGVQHGRQWFGPVIDGYAGMVSLLRGELDVAEAHFEKATADIVATDRDKIGEVWFVPSEPIATAHLHLAWTRLVLGDRAGAQAELAQAARRADELDFPQGPYMRDYMAFMECWIHIETGQLDRAAHVADHMVGQAAERPEFDTMAAAGAHPSTPRSSGLAALAHQRPGRAVGAHRDHDRHCSTAGARLG